VIVECSKCETRFQLEESRVPAGGIRVRCSRCKEAFHLQHPDADEAVATGSIANGTASEVVPGDLDLEEEENWEFSQDPWGDEADDAEPLGTVEVEPDRLEDVELAPEPAFDDLEGPLLLPDSDDVSSQDPGLEVEAGPDLSEGGPSHVAGEIEFGVDDPGARAGEPDDFSSLLEELADEPGEGVGEPADWDFLGDAAEVSGGSPSANEVFETDGLQHRSDLGPRLQVPAVRRHAWLRAWGQAAGWFATLALAALGVALGAFPAVSPLPVSASVELGNLRARAVHASWLETAYGGRLYVVNAELVNETDRPVRVASGIHVALLSPHGERLDVPAAGVGVSLPESLLRERPADELAEAATVAADLLATAALGPGQALQAQAFFVSVPDEAASFRFERVALSSDEVRSTRSSGAARE